MLSDNTGFSTIGTNYIQIGTEKISYTGISVNTLTGVIRGTKQTTTTTHNNGVTILFLPENADLIEIKTKKYFCADEYNIGDKLLFRDIQLSTSTIVNIIDIQNFLMRDNGHTLIKVSNTPVNNRRLFNQFYIPYEYTYNNSDGTSNIKTKFISEPIQETLTIDNIENKNIAINLSLQTSISLNIVTEERTHTYLHTNII